MCGHERALPARAAPTVAMGTGHPPWWPPGTGPGLAMLQGWVRAGAGEFAEQSTYTPSGTIASTRFIETDSSPPFDKV